MDGRQAIIAHLDHAFPGGDGLEIVEGERFEADFTPVLSPRTGKITYDPLRMDEARRSPFGPVVDGVLVCQLTAETLHRRNGGTVFVLDGIAVHRNWIYQRRLYVAHDADGKLVINEARHVVRNAVEASYQPADLDPTESPYSDDLDDVYLRPGI